MVRSRPSVRPHANGVADAPGSGQALKPPVTVGFSGERGVRGFSLVSYSSAEMSVLRTHMFMRLRACR
jgi:hypothetical protein